MGLSDTLNGLNGLMLRMVGETVTYNGEEITALIRAKGADRGDYLESGSADLESMEVTVSLGDVANPGIGDEITYQSETWQAVQVLERSEIARLARLLFERKTAVEGARPEYREG